MGFESLVAMKPLKIYISYIYFVAGVRRHGVAERGTGGWKNPLAKLLQR